MKEILLVEDSDSDAEILERVLRSVGIGNHMRRLVTGTEALAYLIHAEEAAAIGPPVPSILLLDLKLPGFSGFDILERIQNHHFFASTLRIVLSQMDDTPSIKRAYAFGANSFLTKPVQPADLRELVRTFPGYWTFTAAARNSELGLPPRFAARSALVENDARTTFEANRQTLNKIQADLKTLRAHLHDKEQAQSVIDNIMEELHGRKAENRSSKLESPKPETNS